MRERHDHKQTRQKATIVRYGFRDSSRDPGRPGLRTHAIGLQHGVSPASDVEGSSSVWQMM